MVTMFFPKSLKITCRQQNQPAAGRVAALVRTPGPRRQASPQEETKMIARSREITSLIRIGRSRLYRCRRSGLDSFSRFLPTHRDSHSSIMPPPNQQLLEELPYPNAVVPSRRGFITKSPLQSLLLHRRTSRISRPS